MKFKFSLILIALSFSLLKAQENKNVQIPSPEVYKQASGDMSLELNFDPGRIFGSGSGSEFGLLNGGIKFRSFISDKSAYRIGFNLSLNSITNIIQQEDIDFDLRELKSKSSIFSFMVKPGFEKHFSGIERLSPYIGIQGLLGFSTSKLITEHQDINSIYLTKLKNNSPAGYGNIKIGFDLLAGVDYYFYKKMYLGVEIGYGSQFSYFLQTKYTNENDSNLDYKDKNGFSYYASPSLATGNFRFGWVF